MTTMTIPDVSISPTILTRIGGLPVDAVPGASAEIGACLERLDHIEETLDELAQPLIDRIFDVVPTIEDPNARRLVLQAKRQVFAGKAVQARAAEALRANAPAGVASAFDAWEAVRAEREDLESRLEALLGADDDAMRDALTRTVSDTAYLSSLALATPELVDRLIHHKPGRKPSERLVRSLYNYATRTALKTSPFSGLTTVNVAGAVGRGRSTQTVAMHLASGLLHQAARDGEAHPGLVLTPSPVGKVPAEEHDELVMLAQHVHHDGVIFREELVAGAEWAIGEYSDSFTPEVSNARIRRHLEAGLLREQVPWKRGEEPLGALSTVFPEGIGGVSVEDMLGARSVGQECSRSDATGRTDALRRLKDFSSQVFDRGELGVVPAACCTRIVRRPSWSPMSSRRRDCARTCTTSPRSPRRGSSAPSPTISWFAASSSATAWEGAATRHCRSAWPWRSTTTAIPSSLRPSSRTCGPVLTRRSTARSCPAEERPRRAISG